MAISVPFSTNNLTKDTHFLISEIDYELVIKRKWYLKDNMGKLNIAPQYVIVTSATKNDRLLGSPSKISLHRYILNIHLLKNYAEVDHLNHNTFDNTRENLQIKTRHGNQRNRKDNNGLTSLWGVSFIKGGKRAKRYKSKITYNKNRIVIGTFLTELEAHEAAVKKYIEITGKNPNIKILHK